MAIEKLELIYYYPYLYHNCQTVYKTRDTINRKKCIIQYTGKNAKATQWIESFEKECGRFHITENE